MTEKRSAVIALAGLLLLCSSLRELGVAEEAPGKAQIAATYRVDLAAFNLGDFHLTGKLKGPDYELQAQGRFSFISGMIYQASGKTKSAGKLSKLGAEPSSFTVTYKGGKKKEQRRISFVDGTVDEVSIEPAKRQNPHNVPIAAGQLENVLDPLTAAFLSVRSKGSPNYSDVCRQTVPVFDGRQRFDIVLTPKRSERADENAPSGVSGPFAVCRVKFVPIGGYRPDNPGIKLMTQTDDIEVSLVPLPQTDLYVPYRIVVPTSWGRGVITLSKLKLNLDD
jgi:Protein of unknown function (DUF3108)